MSTGQGWSCSSLKEHLKRVSESHLNCVNWRLENVLKIDLFFIINLKLMKYVIFMEIRFIIRKWVLAFLSDRWHILQEVFCWNSCSEKFKSPMWNFFFKKRHSVSSVFLFSEFNENFSENFFLQNFFNRSCSDPGQRGTYWGTTKKYENKNLS